MLVALLDRVDQLHGARWWPLKGLVALLRVQLAVFAFAAIAVAALVGVAEVVWRSLFG